MTISNCAFKLLILLLVASFLLTGCHSYYTIPKDEYDKVSTMEDIKVVYTNGKEFVVEKDDTTFVKIEADSLEVYQGSKEIVIPLSDVEKIKENRFDLGGTITIVMIPLIILVASFFATFDVGG